MMLYPAINDLEKVTHNRYALVIITAKRARQLLEQSENNKVPPVAAEEEADESRMAFILGICAWRKFL